MIPAGFMPALMFGGGGCEFVTKATFTNISGSLGSVNASLSGMAAGDLAVIVVQNLASNTPTAPAGWTTITPPTWAAGYIGKIFWKVLSAGDVLAGVAAVGSVDNSQGGLILAYRGPASVALISTTEAASPATTLSLPGFDLDGNAAGVLAVTLDVNSVTVWSPPADAGIAARQTPVGVGSNFMFAAHDFIDTTDYSEAALVFTGFDGSVSQLGYVLELRL